MVSAVFALIVFAPAIRDAGFAWSRASWCRGGLALLCIYLALTSLMHRRALADVDHFAAANHLVTENRGALPLPPALTHWTGVISTPEGVWRTTFHLPGGAVEQTQFYPYMHSNHFVEVAKKLHDVQVYLWFARFPVWRIMQREEQTIVDVSDVRFYREDDPGASAESRQPEKLARIRTNSTGFTFEIKFNAKGDVITHGFKKP